MTFLLDGGRGYHRLKVIISIHSLFRAYSNLLIKAKIIVLSSKLNYNLVDVHIKLVVINVSSFKQLVAVKT